MKRVYSTKRGAMWHGDGMDLLRSQGDASVNLIITSPPFALTREKAYGNEPEDRYVDWFETFAKEMLRILTEDGSLVIDLGGAWLPGMPTKSLYQFRLLLRLCDDLGYHLAEDFYWFNRAKLPGPREWVTKHRVRVKDSVNTVWWLSKTPHPKANNANVLKPYSPAMRRLLDRKTYNAGRRPSEHVIGDKWATDHGGAIPPNVIEVDDQALAFDNMIELANTTSRDPYQDFCRRNGMKTHPARFPAPLPEFFIRFLTTPGDTVLDPFAGSNVTGALADELDRNWLSIDLDMDYIAGSLGRFDPDRVRFSRPYGSLRAMYRSSSDWPS